MYDDTQADNEFYVGQTVELIWPGTSREIDKLKIWGFSPGQILTIDHFDDFFIVAFFKETPRCLSLTRLRPLSNQKEMTMDEFLELLKD